MTRTAHVTIDPSQASLAQTIRIATRGDSLMILTGHLFADLADELGGADEASRFLATTATNAGRPIGINAETTAGSSTCFVAPKDWSAERLQGWVAGHHEALAEMFGSTTVRHA